MLNWATRVVTPPAAEPVLYADLAAHVRLSPPEVAAQADLLNRKVVAARERCEELTGRQLITATLELVLDDWPECGSEVSDRDGAILLPSPPLQSVTYIKYLDAAGVQQTLAADQYVVESAGTERARIVPARGVAWPATICQPGAVVVRFVAGYGAAASSVPSRLLESILDYAAASYERREDGQRGGISRCEALWAYELRAA